MYHFCVCVCWGWGGRESIATLKKNSIFIFDSRHFCVLTTQKQKLRHGVRNSCFFWFRCPPTHMEVPAAREESPVLLKAHFPAASPAQAPGHLPAGARLRPELLPAGRAWSPPPALPCPLACPCAADACCARGPSFGGSHSVHCPSVRRKVPAAGSQPMGPRGPPPGPCLPGMWGHPLLPLGTSCFLPMSPPQGGGFTYSLWRPRCLARESHFSTCIRGVNAVDERANGPPSSETARRQGTQAASREGRCRRLTERETGPLPRACPAAPDMRFCHGDDMHRDRDAQHL